MISSAYNPQSNGRAEVVVKSTKRLLRSNTSPSGSLDSDKFLFAMLQLRNTVTYRPNSLRSPSSGCIRLCQSPKPILQQLRSIYLMPGPWRKRHCVNVSTTLLKSWISTRGIYSHFDLAIDVTYRIRRGTTQRDRIALARLSRFTIMTVTVWRLTDREGLRGEIGVIYGSLSQHPRSSMLTQVLHPQGTQQPHIMYAYLHHLATLQLLELSPISTMR